MSHLLEILPPPDLSYPPDVLDLDPPIRTFETSYVRTPFVEDDPPAKLQVKDQMTSFLIIVDRFVPARDGRRFCAMCGYVQNS